MKPTPFSRLQLHLIQATPWTRLAEDTTGAYRAWVHRITIAVLLVWAVVASIH